MNKKLLRFILGLTITALAIFIFINLFEITGDERYLPPSREAMLNEYLALDRWLISEGRPVRVLNSGNSETLKAAPEGTILIQSDLFDWSEEAIAWLEAWVEKGGSLILCLDYYRTWYEDELGAFLGSLGLEPGEESGEYRYNRNSSLFPSFGRNIHFREPDEAGVFLLKDEDDYIRLVQFQKGPGKITVLGRPRFMTSSRLDEETNIRLSWYLLTESAAYDRTSGILFIRGERPAQGLLGRIFRHGNPLGLIISALVLIAAGFWSVIPVFGVIKGNEEKPGKALAERFLAEGRFLERFGALDSYRTAYFRELRRRLMKRGKEEEAASRAFMLLESEAPGRGVGGKNLSPAMKKNFLESIVALKTTLERL